jgi:hypothetical protein
MSRRNISRARFRAVILPTSQSAEKIITLMAATGSVCNFSAADFASALDNQNSIIKVAITQNISYADPYSNVVAQKTFQSGYGEQQIYTASPRIALNQSSVRPVFAPFSASCQSVGAVANWGNEKYVSTPGILDGQSQPICIKQEYFVVEGLLEQSIESLKSAITDLVSWDIRANLLDLSGIKFVVPAPGASPESGYTGGEWAVATNFKNMLPGDRLTFKYAKWLRDKIFYQFRPPGFGRGADSHAILITSYELNDALRTDAPLNNALNVSTQGSFADGHDAQWSYAFIDSNFRGIKFAIDPTPLRFDTIDGNGNPQLIEAYATTNTNSAGKTWQVRPAWENANYEISFMIFSNTAFARLTPEAFNGEGAAKFGNSMFGGELEWFNQKESCNRWGDLGWFQFRIVRAIQPMFPHFVVAISSKRCRGSFTDSTSTCAGVTDVNVTI